MSITKKELKAAKKRLRKTGWEGASGMAALPARKRRAPRKRAGPNRVNPVLPPSRNGQGRKRGQRRQRGGVTTFGNTRNFTIPIDEDLGTLTSSTGYAVLAISLNPGNPLFLPFISRVAQNYERYEFKRLRFEFRPSAGVFATVGAQGLVGICATMDAVQVVPSTQAQADVLFHGPIVETAKATSLTLPTSFLQSKSKREKFFVRQSGFIPGGTDPHSYDCGQVFFWTNGQAGGGGAPIGTLHVTGLCELSNPASDLSVGFPPNFTTAIFTEVNGATAASGVTAQVFFANIITNPVGITVGSTASTPPGSVFTLPAGNWNVDFTADVDINGVNATGNLVLSCAAVGIGVPPGYQAIGPTISQTVPGPLAANTVAIHAAVSQSWMIPSNGATQFQINYALTYAAGVPDIDAMIRFTAI